jgi:chromosome partitioning protein
MAKIFCIANQKGGVGKTTTTVNLAAGLAKVGQRVLMIDLDPQGNATMGSGIDKRQLELTVYDVLLESASVAEARVAADKLVEGGAATTCWAPTANWPVPRSNWWRRPPRARLRTALAAVGAEYDFILIDCPPSLSMLTLNGLCAAHGVIVPMQCEYFALEG